MITPDKRGIVYAGNRRGNEYGGKKPIVKRFRFDDIRVDRLAARFKRIRQLDSAHPAEIVAVVEIGLSVAQNEIEAVLFRVLEPGVAQRSRNFQRIIRDVSVLPVSLFQRQAA